MENYYQILGIPKNASAEVIKAAYEGQISIPHEITNTDYDNMHQLLKLSEAYNILKSPEKRFFYDIIVNEDGDIAQITFDDQLSINRFTNNIYAQISYLHKENNKFETEIERCKNSYKSKTEELETVINIISKQLAVEAADNLQNKNKLMELNKLYKNVLIEYQRLQVIEKETADIKEQNTMLLNTVKSHKILRYKAVVSVSAFITFVFLLIYINF